MLKEFNFLRSGLAFTLLIFAFILPQNLSIAQSDVKDIKLGEQISIYSEILGQDRIVMVSKPAVNANIGKKLPVMYVLDGGAHFNYISGIVSYLSAQNLIPPVIVVAIRNINRNVDFTPTADKNVPGSGGASDFHAFIEKELIPFIGQKYYTSDYKLLVGHSLGGTFATYSLLFRPDVFDAYISISPYLQFGDEILVNKTAKNLLDKYEKAKYLYMTLGDEPDYVPVHGEFLDILNEKKPGNLEFDYVVMEKESHGTTPLLTVYNGLLAIFSDWNLSAEKFMEGVESIDKHFAYLSDKYDVDIEANEQMINILGYTYIGEKQFDKAIQVLEENTKRYPKSANVYDSLGDAYTGAGRFEEAKANYIKAVKLGTKQKSPFLNTYKKNLEKIEKELDSIR